MNVGNIRPPRAASPARRRPAGFRFPQEAGPLQFCSSLRGSQLGGGVGVCVWVPGVQCEANCRLGWGLVQALLVMLDPGLEETGGASASEQSSSSAL